MSEKFKKDKNKLNGRILVLVISIILLPVLVGTIVRYCSNEKKYNYDTTNYIHEVYNAVNYLQFRTDGIDGPIEEYTIKSEINRIREGYQKDYDYNKKQVEQAKEDGYNLWDYRYTEEDMKVAEKALNRSEDEVRKEAIDNVEAYLSYYRDVLESNINVEFYFERSDEDKPFTNVSGKSKDEFRTETLSGKYNDYLVMYGENNGNENIDSNISDTLKDFVKWYPEVYNHSLDVYIRIANPVKSGDFLYTKIQRYKSIQKFGYASIGFLTIDILCILGLLISIKKKPSKVSKGILIKIYRKLFLEIRLLVYVLIPVLISAIYIMVSRGDIYYIYTNLILLVSFGYLSISDLFIIRETYKRGNLREYCVDNFLIIKLLTLVKESLILKSTAIRVICSIIYLVIYAILVWSTGVNLSMYWNYNFFTISLIVVSVIMTLGIICYLIIVGKEINRLKISTDNIVKGNYKNDIKIKGAMVLKDIANNVRNIEDGLSTAVQRAVGSEKMKGELITNVSHDLKTPLTSIINYVDLLSKDNVSEEDKEKYIGVLKEKSSRLNVLIEDLFEASKADSGAMELVMENIDPVALLRQTIGEFEDRIKSSGLQFINKIPEEKIIVYADGRKTFRIFQNLLSNILKYSMPYSRVYIEAKEEETGISITFKNISQFELDFSEEEIMERFKRGDASRTTEGSGLGLSIAKSLIELQGGSFSISIDGDLFKATVTLRKGKLDSK